MTDAGVVAALDVLVAADVLALVAAAAATVGVATVAATGVLEATRVTAAVEAVVVATAPIDPVCQMAPKASANEASEVATTRRRMIENRRARSSSRFWAVLWGVGVGGMPSCSGPPASVSSVDPGSLLGAAGPFCGQRLGGAPSSIRPPGPTRATTCGLGGVWGVRSSWPPSSKTSSPP